MRLDTVNQAVLIDQRGCIVTFLSHDGDGMKAVSKDLRMPFPRYMHLDRPHSGLYYRGANDASKKATHLPGFFLPIPDKTAQLHADDKVNMMWR